MGFFDKIKAGLAKTRSALADTLGGVFTGFSERTPISPAETITPENSSAAAPKSAIYFSIRFGLSFINGTAISAIPAQAANSPNSIIPPAFSTQSKLITA